MNLVTVIGRSVLIATLTALTLPVHSQSAKCKSVSVEWRPACANMIVEFRGITTSKLAGSIENPIGEPILVEVFAIRPQDKKGSSYSLADDDRRIVAFETDVKGKFCHPGLPEGDYVLRFGTISGGWNCSYQKVKIRNRAAERKTKVSLEIGI